MPKSRRKSVAFAEPAEEPEAPCSTRRSGRGAVDDQPPPPPAAAAAAAAAPSRVTRASAGSGGSVSGGARTASTLESDGGFKFKRRKVVSKDPPATAAATPADVAMVDDAAAPLMVGEPAAAPPVPPAPSAPSDVAVPAAPAAPAEPVQSTAPIVPAAPAAAPTAPAAAPPPPRPPQEPPSLLSGAPRELLYAIHEVITDAAAAAKQADTALPTMDLALAACRGELDKLGVRSAPPPSQAAEELRAREVALLARVADLEATIGEWDAAARQTPEPRMRSRVGAGAGAGDEAGEASTGAAADGRVLALLPALPPIEAQLAELAALAAMCAEQVDAASRLATAQVGAAEAERVRLAAAAHKASFRGYLDVDEPKLLLRSILSGA